MDPAYDHIGAGYSNRRRADICIERHLHRAMGTAQQVVDLESGRWDANHGHLRTLDELAAGHRLLTAV